MARARNGLIDLSETPYYHLCSRCVRRAFLTGEDAISHKNYNHRRPWIVNRFKFLSDVFAIDICAFAIMSNHYHLVIKVDQREAMAWSEDEVIQRWTQICRQHPLVHSYQQGRLTSQVQKETAQHIIKTWRQRLFDISWFMRLLNEHIARRANQEDNCKGRFWEGRFHSQALLDEKALLCCMVYVDLNPIRAGMAHTLETSNFTSIQQRLEQYQQTTHRRSCSGHQHLALLPFVKKSYHSGLKELNLTFNDYLYLIRWTGQCIHPANHQKPASSPALLTQQLKIDTEDWLAYARHFRRRYSNFAGCAQRLYQYAQSHNHLWYKGVG